MQTDVNSFEWRTPAERVAAGAAFLNEVLPGWEKKIVLESLDINQWEECILGQLFGDFDKGCDQLGLSGGKCEKYGFWPAPEDMDAEDAHNLTREWTAAIRGLRG